MTALKMVTVAMVAALVVAGVAGGEDIGHFVARRAILLDENFVPVAAPVPAAEAPRAPRLRRDTGYGHVPHKGYSKGRVGPVYTFVKTDYNGNFKWGVRHRAGSQYAGGYH
ncbi:uncharacterized protein LOC127010465 [Eriocheir sinensis]|uniref:uncharacterized protein LOC127010465 n=1 Tax=Eriocheir sinensis TaxID=95602 RepID=UPI0021C790F0|nr:uncharacterized protein LOC127010465 [Eriocheir sinensis]